MRVLGISLTFITLTAWKTLLWLYTPIPTTDGVQSLSHTYSLLQGDFLHSRFLHHWMELYQLPYGFGVATAPLMAVLPFGTVHNYFVAALIFALIGGFAAWRLVLHIGGPSRRDLALLCGAAVGLHPHLWTMRPEVLAVPLLTGALILLLTGEAAGAPGPRCTRLASVGASFLVAFAGIAHPIAGMVGILMIGMVGWERRWRPGRIAALWAMTIGFAVALYLPVILVDASLWFENFVGFFTREDPRGVTRLGSLAENMVRPMGWSLPLLLLYGVGLLRAARELGVRLWREGAYAMLFLIPIVLGGNGSYYAYLLVLLVWRIASLWRLKPRALPRPAFAALALILPFWSHYVPTFQTLENPAYGETARVVLAEVERYSGREEGGLVWVSSRIGMPIIDEPYSRVILNYYTVGRYDAPLPFAEGDDALLMWEDEQAIMAANYDLPPDARIEAVIPSVPGLITVESLFRARQAGIGLWRLTR